MSATGRRSKNNKARAPHDYYPTPTWCVYRFLEKAKNRLHKGKWLEPCAGDGAIIRSINSFGIKCDFDVVELQEKFKENLEAISNVSTITFTDYLKWDYLANSTPKNKKADVALTNPPYKLALPIIEHSMKHASQVCMLLRINFLASEARCNWMKKNTPDIYVLPNRPSFRGKGSDACEYAWFVWDDKSSGKITILDVTPENVRRKEKREIHKKMLTI